LTKRTGDEGEALAVDFLKEKGYTILETKWRFKHLEVDIIAQFLGQLVFIEVKTGSAEQVGEPEAWVTLSKQKRILNAAMAYISEGQHNLEARFDVIAVVLGTPQSIRHIEDAFSSSS